MTPLLLALFVACGQGNSNEVSPPPAAEVQAAPTPPPPAASPAQPAAPAPQPSPEPTPLPEPEPESSPDPAPASAPPPPTGPSIETSDDELERGRLLLLANDYPAAIAHFERLLEEASESKRVEAQLRLGQALLGSGEVGAGVEVLQRLRAEYDDSPQAHQAAFFLAEAEAGRGEFDAAAAHLSALAQDEPRLAPLLRLKQSQWAMSAGRADLAARAAEAGLTEAESRRLRIELLEALARARGAVGDREGALEARREIVDLAANAAYLADQLYVLARADREMGRDEEGLSTLRAIVRDYPHTGAALRALELLNQSDQLPSAELDQLGHARYRAGNYRGAIEAFEEYLDRHPLEVGADAARLYRWLAALAPGREWPAIEELEQLARETSDPTIAARALLEAGKGYESAGSFGAAAATYQAMAWDDEVAGTPAAAEAGFRLGVALYMLDEYERALDAWSEFLDSARSAESKAQALYWSGKALERLERYEDALQAWEEAAAQPSLGYFALRAGHRLDPERPAPSFDAIAGREARAVEEQDLAEWLAERALDLAEARAEVLADPVMEQARLLVSLGLHWEASWTTEELLARYAGEGDRLYVAAEAFHALGLYRSGTQLGSAALTALAGRDAALDVPRALARTAHPLAWAELVWPTAEDLGIDPLLFTALIRQESAFEPRAQSSALARGLTQIVPGTASDIVRALGISDFHLEQLYMPVVSVHLGGAYFADRLKLYEGDPYLALAAYNAGGGNVNRWLAAREWMAEPDVFAEYIPFAETHLYIRRVFSYWEIYRALYAQS